jgi:G3E family GTPase
LKTASRVDTVVFIEKIMNKKVRIILLSGFLGSGKTTLLKHIMSFDADMSDIVIIMNEIGEVGIDGMLLKNLGSDVVELTSGCICCSMSDDLQESIEEILQRFGPRYIIIEATGVADPESVSKVIAMSNFKDKVELYKIITVMDAECWEVRDVFGTLFFRQLKQADTIIFNKIDLLRKDDIPQYLNEIHRELPGTQVIPAINCRIEPEVVWLKPATPGAGNSAFDENRRELRRNDHVIFPYFDHKTGIGSHQEKIYADKNFVTFSFSESSPVDETAFNRFIQELPYELFRLKGMVNFGNRTMMINSVGGRTEWSPWEGDSETRLAFIGWNIDPDEFLAT